MILFTRTVPFLYETMKLAQHNEYLVSIVGTDGLVAKSVFSAKEMYF